MVFAHAVVIARSADDQGARLQALVGAAGYTVALIASCLAPSVFARNRRVRLFAPTFLPTPDCSG